MGSRSADAPAEAIADYTCALWDGLAGWACLGLGGGPHLVDGKYGHESFEQQFFAWPKQAQKITRVALRAAPDHDVWVCPMLRIEPLRRTETGIGGRHLWADIDQTLNRDASDLVDRLSARDGSFTVASGTSGHQHLYIRLHEHLSADAVVALNQRLAASIRADAKWDETSLLRLPGTLNHKARVAGGSATPVRIVGRRP